MKTEELAAGRELDAKVAKALGCNARVETGVRRDGEAWITVYCECGKGQHDCDRFDDRRISTDSYEVSPYSTDDAAALAALKEYADTNKMLVEIVFYRSNGQAYEVTITHVDGQESEGGGFSNLDTPDSLALAICRCIVAASESKGA